MKPAILTAALTGPLARKADHPGLPCSPAEIAEAAAASYAAGAAVVHVHLRDEHGEPTADLDVARRTVAAIQERCPAWIQLSTGVGLDVDYEDRVALVEARPTMATLNVCSMSFGGGEFRNPPEGVRRLASRMRELGIKPELEVYDSGHIEVALDLVREGLLEAPLQFSFVLGVKGGMAATPANLVHMVQRLPEGSVWQAIGIGRANLPMTAIALAMGGNARTGMEDTLMLRAGVPTSGNGELVARLAGIAEALERPVAGVEQAGEILELAGRTPAA